MRNFFWLSGVFLFLLTVTGTFAQQPTVVVNVSETLQVIDGKSFYFHPVKKGQTLFSISQAYGVSQEAIVEQNPDIQNSLRYDQIILIPKEDDLQDPQVPEVREPSKPIRFIEHTVRRKETLYGIARQYGLSMEEILVYNPEASKGLRPRQVLRIPVKEEPQQEVYVVAAGETLYSISRRFNVAVEDLLEANPGLTTDIKPGQPIVIPEARIMIPEQETLAGREGYVFLPAEDTQERVQEPVDATCQDLSLKDQYNVALLIPLYLEELDTLPSLDQMSASHRSFSFIEYYKGVLIALDSVKTTLGVDITLHVFDVDQSMAKARKGVESPGFNQMDLIIGPFFSQTLSLVAEYGRRNNIPVVSPLLPDNKLLKGFPNLFQAVPSPETQLRDMAGYIARTYTDQNIILVHNSQQQAVNLINSFRQSLEDGIRATMFQHDSLNLARVNGYFLNGSLVGDRRTNVMVMNDSILTTRTGEVAPEDYFRQNPTKEVVFTREGMDGVLNALEKNKKNVIVTLIGGEAFLSDYLRQLNHDSTGYDMTVFGTRQWENYNSLEVDYLQNLNVHLYSPYYLNYQDRHIKNFLLRYRKVFGSEPRVYGPEPRSYAYEGVQTAWFFFNALALYGEDFPRCIQMMNNQHYQNPFLFSRLAGDQDSGWENTKTTIFRYLDYQKMDVRRPAETE
ncbi:MAG: LysM peptidoglycan-binding domain-containing protein [Bacteroidales bacterium]